MGNKTTESKTFNEPSPIIYEKFYWKLYNNHIMNETSFKSPLYTDEEVLPAILDLIAVKEQGLQSYEEWVSKGDFNKDSIIYQAVLDTKRILANDIQRIREFSETKFEEKDFWNATIGYEALGKHLFSPILTCFGKGLLIKLPETKITLTREIALKQYEGIRDLNSLSFAGSDFPESYSAAWVINGIDDLQTLSRRVLKIENKSHFVNILNKVFYPPSVSYEGKSKTMTVYSRETHKLIDLNFYKSSGFDTDYASEDQLRKLYSHIIESKTDDVPDY